MRFVRVEPGTFSMGNDREQPAEMVAAREHGGREIWLPARGDHDERPVHRVTISRPFYLGVTEVTNEQYEKFDPRHMLLRGRTGFSIDGDEADPVGRRGGDFKVTRGGSHSTVAFYLRSANRLGTLPEDTSWLIGFRVA